MFGLVLLCAVATAHQHHHHAATPPDLTSTPLAHPPAGAVRGAWLQTRRLRPLQAYRGIRYAEPPVGERRFQPPVPILQYKVEVDASVDGPACPQPTFGDYPVDEDCLTLNVYTPGDKRKTVTMDAEKPPKRWVKTKYKIYAINPVKTVFYYSKGPLPVLVFLHAGGFYSISGRSDVAGPDYLLDRDFVLVTVNYRLASLGFLSTGDELAPGNNGFKDQVAALRWVRRNIAAFGGDPELVTLAGYSAGAFSVMLHTVSPMSTGLFHRAISMSGSPISQIRLPAHQRHLAERQASLLACPTNTTADMLACLKTKTAKELGDSLDNMFEFGYDPVLLWVPLVEPDFGQERFLIEDPLESLRSGRFSRVPYIVSQTTDEFFWKAFNILENSTLTHTLDSEWPRLAPVAFYLTEPSEAAAAKLREAYLDDRPLRNDSFTAEHLGKLYSDAIIGFGAHSLANALAVYSPSDTWYYQFAYIGNRSHYQDPETNKPIGAAHHDDLIYLFSINASFPLIAVSDAEDSKMVDRMTAIFYNFARYGNPNPQPDTPELTFSWLRMEPATRRYLRLDKATTVHEKLFEDRFQVWERLYRPPSCDICTA